MPALRRTLTWTLLACALLPPLLAAIALGLALQSQPLVTQSAALSPDDIERARQLLLHNDPRGKLPGITRAVVLSQRDLELLANQGARHLGGRLDELQARVRLQPGLALVQASVPAPGLPGRWLNLQAVLRQTDALPDVESLRLGHLPVPGWLAEAALPRLLAALDLRAQGELAQRLFSRVVFRAQQVVLAYAWPADFEQELSNTLLPPADQQRLKAYAERLAALSAELAPPGGGLRRVSMARLLPPVFALARERSADAGDAVRENRAALLALAFLANGRGLSVLLPVARQWPRPAPLAVTLAGRRDTPQHYLISAALAAAAGDPLADAIGLYKEVADSRGGSGFSFNDLAADRAGTRLGQLAVRHPQALQARLAAAPTEADLLPAIADLPEGLSEREFQRRYGSIDSPAYRQVTADIEARLNRLPLLAVPR